MPSKKAGGGHNGQSPSKGGGGGGGKYEESAALSVKKSASDAGGNLLVLGDGLAESNGKATAAAGDALGEESVVIADLSTENQTTLLTVVILALIAVVAFASRLFAVVRFESIIHEFDPWFNFRVSKYLSAHGYYQFWNWFDERAWYPLGRVVGGTLYPGLMVTTALLHNILHALSFPIDIREVSVMMGPLYSGLTAVAAFLLTKEVKDARAGLLAAMFLGIVPGYISRSVAGSYDYECIAIFILMFTFYLWIKALKLGSMAYGAATALSYFYMVSSWGGYVFLSNMLPLHAFVLILMGRYSARLYVAYSTFYIIGTLASMQIPFVGFAPIRTSEHMAPLGIFGLVQLLAFNELLRAHLPERQFKLVLKLLVVLAFLLSFAALVFLTMSGFIAPWTGRFYSLWDTGYAKIHIPIIASVSEHQPTAWPSFFFDLNLLIFFFPAGVWLLFKELRDEHVFLVVYAVMASYFSGVMVRLMLTLTPVVCISAAVAISSLLDTYLESPERSKSTSASSTKKGTGKLGAPGSWIGIVHTDTKLAVVAPLLGYLCLFVLHCTWVTSNAYSSPSVVLASRHPNGAQLIIDDFREAYYWLRQNTREDAKVMSWWDYGYQISGMADRTTIVDNNTWNNTHIATVGKAMSSPEHISYPILRRHDVDYVLIIFGGLIGYSGDDINKFLWMIRIAQGVWPDELKESDFFNRGEYRVDEHATPAMRNSLMYKMSYYRFNDLFQGGAAQDRVRGAKIPAPGPTLDTLDEAFTSENWLVRIYAVKPPDFLGRPFPQVRAFEKA